MTDAAARRYRARLLQLGQRVNLDISQLASEALRASGGEAAGGLSDTPIHKADVASEVYDHEIALDLLEHEEKARAEIAQALERIEKGTFGVCEGCGRAIAAARLDAIPFTRYCIDCERKAEAAEAAKR